MGAKGVVIAILVITILVLVGFFIASYFNGGGILFKDKNKVDCVVSVHNPLLSDTFEIESASCSVTDSCGFLNSLSVFGDNTANVRLTANGATLSSVNVAVGDIIGTTQTVQLGGCVAQTTISGVVEVRNSQGILTDSQGVNF